MAGAQTTHDVLLERAVVPIENLRLVGPAFPPFHHRRPDLASSVYCRSYEQTRCRPCAGSLGNPSTSVASGFPLFRFHLHIHRLSVGRSSSPLNTCAWDEQPHVHGNVWISHSVAWIHGFLPGHYVLCLALPFASGSTGA